MYGGRRVIKPGTRRFTPNISPCLAKKCCQRTRTLHKMPQCNDRGGARRLSTRGTVLVEQNNRTLSRAPSRGVACHSHFDVPSWTSTCSTTGVGKKKFILYTSCALLASFGLCLSSVRHHSSCAIVLNSGILALGYNYGSLIDQHEVVVRFNMAPTKGYERFVGTKTSYMWTWHHHFNEFESKMNTEEYRTTKIMIGPYLWDQKKLGETGIPLSRRESPEAAMLVNNCRMNWLSEDDAKQFPSKRCTSGIYAIVFFLKRCKQVNVFGVHPWAHTDNACSVPLHYWGNYTCSHHISRAQFDDQGHNFTHERRTLVKYSKMNARLKLYPETVLSI